MKLDGGPTTTPFSECDGPGPGCEFPGTGPAKRSCGSWRRHWRVGALMAASVVSLYGCVFWLIYALSIEGGRRPGLFISATCLLFLVALGVTLLSVRKLCDLLTPEVAIPV